MEQQAAEGMVNFAKFARQNQYFIGAAGAMVPFARTRRASGAG
jgi:hypothetical protein